MTRSSQPHRVIPIVAQSLHHREPEPAPVNPQLNPLIGIGTVVFDVYGTLVTSGLGEVGTAESGRQSAFEGVLRRFAPPDTASPDQLAAEYYRAIDASHRRSRAMGVEHPEVDILAIWERVFERLGIPQPESFQDVAVTYEVDANPSWLMPGAKEILQWLNRSGYRLAIVSNAQFYTPILLEWLLGDTLGEVGFEATVWSYELGVAKPSVDLFHVVSERLHLSALSSALYIGNDMLNDVTTAAKAGFRTVLFAGDAASLRLRPEDHRVSETIPDAVVTHLSQLKSILTTGEAP